jgi:hypothetical protein
MPANREPRTMDNPYYDWSPISTRAPIRWPGSARVALCVIVNLEHMDWLPPEGSFVAPSARAPGDAGRTRRSRISTRPPTTTTGTALAPSG